jgi:hypothetical protein
VPLPQTVTALAAVSRAELAVALASHRLHPRGGGLAQEHQRWYESHGHGVALYLPKG